MKKTAAIAEAASTASEEQPGDDRRDRRQTISHPPREDLPAASGPQITDG
jgi:hypothetical protein